MTDQADDFPDDLTDVESDEMAFHMTRAKPQPGRTFSKEAMDQFTDAMNKYVASRIKRHWDMSNATVPGPVDIKVIVTVSVDGAEPVRVPDDQYPWFAIDGTLRRVN